MICTLYVSCRCNDTPRFSNSSRRNTYSRKYQQAYLKKQPLKFMVLISNPIRYLSSKSIYHKIALVWRSKVSLGCILKVMMWIFLNPYPLSSCPELYFGIFDTTRPDKFVVVCCVDKKIVYTFPRATNALKGLKFVSQDWRGIVGGPNVSIIFRHEEHEDDD